MRFLNLLLTLFMGIAASVAPPTSDPVPADAIENGAQGYPIAGYIYGRNAVKDYLYIMGFWRCQGVTTFEPTFASMNKGVACKIFRKDTCDDDSYIFEMKPVHDYVLRYGSKLWFKCRWTKKPYGDGEADAGEGAIEGAESNVTDAALT